MFPKTQRTRARCTRALGGQKTQVLRDGPFYTWPDTELRILGAGVSVHLTYGNNDGKVGIYTNRACEFNHEQRTNEFTVCVYKYVCVRMYIPCVCIVIRLCVRTNRCPCVDDGMRVCLLRMRVSCFSSYLCVCTCVYVFLCVWCVCVCVCVCRNICGYILYVYMSINRN